MDVEGQMHCSGHERSVESHRRISNRAPELGYIALVITPVAVALREISPPEEDDLRIELGELIRARRKLSAESLHESLVRFACRVESSLGFVESSGGGEGEASLEVCKRVLRQARDNPVELAQRTFIVAKRQKRLAVHRMGTGPVRVARKEPACVFQRRLAPRVADLREGAMIAKLRILRSFLEERKKELLGLPQAPGAEMSERKLALLCSLR